MDMTQVGKHRFSSVRMMQTVTTGASTSDRFGLRRTLGSLGGELVSLHQVKRERRSKEDDVHKLHNRIKMLEQEEAKVRRKIEETRRKAQSILEIRMTKTGRSPSSNRALTPEQQFRGSLYLERKQEHERIMHERMSSLIQQKREDASLIKRERRIILRKKLKFERAAIRVN